MRPARDQLSEIVQLFCASSTARIENVPLSGHFVDIVRTV
jgi:hypothetical protein